MWFYWLLLGILSVCLVPVILVIYSVFHKPQLDFKYEERTWLLVLIVKAVISGFNKKRGVLENEEQNKTENLQMTARDCRLSLDHIRQYAALCGYPGKLDQVPPCYLDALLLPHVLLTFTTSQHFRLNPLGLILVKQSIKQHTNVEHLFKEPFDVEAQILEYKPTDEGVEVECGMKLYDRREMCIWESSFTFLSRNQSADDTPSSTKEENEEEEKDGIRRSEQLTVKLAGSLGLRYAWVTGDWNPHHLWPWTSRPLGYKKPVVQSMWTLARALSHLQTSGLFPLKPPFHISARFKRPVPIPGTSVFTFNVQADKDKFCFSVHDQNTGASQLTAQCIRS